MNLIPIPSEHCPHCQSPKGQCAVMVKEVDTLKMWSVKVNEADYRAEMQGKRNPTYREAYMVQKFVCLQGKGDS
jgi:hypothetical protein